MNNKVVRRHGVQSRGNAVARLAWAGAADPANPLAVEAEVAVARAGGLLQCLSVDTGEPVAAPVLVGASPVGISVLRNGAGPLGRSYVVGTAADGLLRVVRVPEASGEGNGAAAAEAAQTIKIGEGIEVTRLDGEDGRFVAAGGKERLLRVLDLETGEEAFKARNVPHDFLDMRVPVWVTDAHFLPGSGGSRLVTGTSYHQVRLYDTRASNRAVLSVDVGEHAVVSTAVSPDGRFVVAGDGAGFMTRVDLRKGALAGRFKHIGGSVRSVSYHATMPYVASAGLDRQIRVHHSSTRKLVNKVYAKQRVNCLLFSAARPNEGIFSEKKKKEDEEDREADEVWSELDARGRKKGAPGDEAKAGDEGAAEEEAVAEEAAEEEAVEEESDEDDEDDEDDDDDEDEDEHEEEEPETPKKKRERRVPSPPTTRSKRRRQ